MTTATTEPGEPHGGLIGRLLADQADLTAVERFAQFHEDAEAPLHGQFYRSLLPAAPPGPGQQYAFEVDLDRCSGCKACVAACHALNGLDEAESWREVGLIVGRVGGLPVLQHVTSSCHHCLEPACLTACPVDAYEKDPITGIVRHLDDQCFGCQYCTLACPYDAPKYHAGKGIVRKCDLCTDRLAVGEAPACVQGCPHEAIRIRVVDQEVVAAQAAANVFLPAEPDPSLTRPTTLYLSNRAFGPGVRPLDGVPEAPEHAPVSLVLMLVLTQASVGAVALNSGLHAAGRSSGGPSNTLLTLGLGLGYAGLFASLFHLGRPWLAYRALIGLRHSWLSREVAAFGAYITLATASLKFEGSWITSAAALTGLVAIVCSAMVYHATRRPFWNLRPSLARFGGTAALLGAATLLLTAAIDGQRGLGVLAAVVVTVVTFAKLHAELRLLSPAGEGETTPAAGSARLLRTRLAGAWRLRRALGVLGGAILPVAWIGGSRNVTPAIGLAVATLTLLVATAGELSERYLFFAAVTRPKMPRGRTR